MGFAATVPSLGPARLQPRCRVDFVRPRAARRLVPAMTRDLLATLTLATALACTAGCGHRHGDQPDGSTSRDGSAGGGDGPIGGRDSGTGGDGRGGTGDAGTD